jgi:dATP pyrophosphohydrolase
MRYRSLPERITGVTVYACRVRDGAGEFLVLRRAPDEDFPGLWQPVTGGIHDGETAVEAALRELAEETSLVPSSLYSANLLQSFYDPLADGILTLPVFAAFVEPDRPIRLSGEHDAHRWIEPDQADEVFAFQQQADCLEEIDRRFVRREPSEYLRIPL